MSVTWDRRLVPVTVDELCAPFGHGVFCDDPVAYRLTYWSRQGRFRTPAMSTRLFCSAHAKRYLEIHAGDVQTGKSDQVMASTG